MKAVAYYRVSTAGQGRSGLGLDAQKSSVNQLAVSRRLELQSEFIEIESGKRNDRTQLTAALNHARLTGSILVIAKLDRLSRNAAFLLALRDSGVRFIAADIPDANDVTIGVLAVIAQAEREAISKRTSEALAEIKRRIAANERHVSARTGNLVVRLGNPRGTEAIRRAKKGNAAAVAALSASANNRSQELRPVIESISRAHGSSYSRLAQGLNSAGILTARGGRWHASTVRLLVRRAALQATPSGTAVSRPSS